jgi:hypothetical protein
MFAQIVFNGKRPCWKKIDDARCFRENLPTNWILNPLKPKFKGWVTLNFRNFNLFNFNIFTSCSLFSTHTNFKKFLNNTAEHPTYFLKKCVTQLSVKSLSK